MIETRVSPSFGHPPLQAGLTGSQTSSSRYQSSLGKHEQLQLTPSSQQPYPNAYQYHAMPQNQYYQRPTPARTGITPSHISAGASRVPPVNVGQAPYSCPNRITSYPAVSAAVSYSPSVAGAQPRQHSIASKSSNLSITTSTRNKSPNTVLISKLPPQQSEKELRSILEQYGSLVYLDIGPKTPSTEKAKGTAKARYDCATEALAAVQGLNGSSLGGCKIKVRQEKADKTLSLQFGGKPGIPIQESGIVQPTAAQSPRKASYRATQGQAKSDNDSTGSSSPKSGPLIVDGARCLCTDRNGKSSGIASGSVETQDENSSDESDEDSSEGDDDGMS